MECTPTTSSEEWNKLRILGSIVSTDGIITLDAPAPPHAYRRISP